MECLMIAGRQGIAYISTMTTFIKENLLVVILVLETPVKKNILYFYLNPKV